MKNVIFTLLLTFVFATVSQTINAQGFPYHLYAPRTMAELTELNSVDENTQTIGKTQIAISAKPFYSAVRVEYAGKVRNLTERKLAFYKIWATVLDVESSTNEGDILDIIQKEYLFKECDKEYWITVSTPAANDFPKDMKMGDRITLYLMIAGGRKFDKEDWDYMYLTNSFRTYH